MADAMFHPMTKEINQKRRELAPGILDAWENFSRAAFAPGAIDEKTKQLLAIAVAHTTQCPYCIRGHTKLALSKGCSEEEIMEAVWVAAEMRSGAAMAHSTLAIEEMSRAEASKAK